MSSIKQCKRSAGEICYFLKKTLGNTIYTINITKNYGTVIIRLVTNSTLSHKLIYSISLSNLKDAKLKNGLCDVSLIDSTSDYVEVGDSCQTRILGSDYNPCRSIEELFNLILEADKNCRSATSLDKSS